MKLAIISPFRDEAKWLPEWIEFHLMMGVDKFYLREHVSTDGEEILRPYIEQGIVEYIHDPVETLPQITPKAGDRRGESLTVGRANVHWNTSIKKSQEDWMAFINVDEFLYPKSCSTLKEYLHTIPSDISQIKVNWVNFSPNGVTLQPNELLIERLTKCYPKIKDNVMCCHTKPLFRPHHTKYIPSPHHVQLDKGKTTDASFNEENANAAEGHLNKIFCDEGLIINHYRWRDESFKQQKLEWYKKWGRSSSQEEEKLKLYSEAEDTFIQKFVPDLKKRLFS